VPPVPPPVVPPLPFVPPLPLLPPVSLAPPFPVDPPVLVVPPLPAAPPPLPPDCCRAPVCGPPIVPVHATRAKHVATAEDRTLDLMAAAPSGGLGHSRSYGLVARSLRDASRRIAYSPSLTRATSCRELSRLDRNCHGNCW